MAMITIFVHSPDHSLTRSPCVFLLSAASVLLLVQLTRLENLLRRNINDWEVYNVTNLNGMKLGETAVQDSIEIEVHLRRPWVIEAGQYVYFRGHPFYISRWDGNVIYLIVERHGGFTNRLYGKCGRTKALIEGPYGRRLDLWNLGNGVVNTASDKYTDILVFATGMGIAGQLPYLNEILASSLDTRIKVYWEILSAGQTRLSNQMSQC